MVYIKISPDWLGENTDVITPDHIQPFLVRAKNIAIRQVENGL
jgi:hypothetical protein